MYLGYFGDLWSLDPESEKWTLLSDLIDGLPFSRYSHGISMVGSTCYTFGGFNEQGTSHLILKEWM
jgi:hypothetical protein